MPPVLYAHPFSSYCQKVLIALYENGTDFTYRLLGPDDPAAMTELEALWPLKRFPVLVDNGRSYIESSIIIEHLALSRPGPCRLLPAEPAVALEVRKMDRVFDNYVMTPMQRIVADHMRPPEGRDPTTVAESKALLQSVYNWLNEILPPQDWAVDGAFSLADCAAAPSLFYADWVHPIDEGLDNLRAYRKRLLARPSVARAMDEARPYRPLFPPGAPDRD